MAVGYEQVEAVCDAMVAAGEKPSVRKVREKLGNTGSAGTISGHMQKWWKKQNADSEKVVIPAPLQRMLLTLIEQERAAVRAVVEDDLATLQQELAELAEENETLRAGLAERDGAIAQLREREAVLAAGQQAAEQARVELARAQLRLEGLAQLEQVLHQTRADLEREREGRIMAEREVAVLTTRLEVATTVPLHQTLLSGERRRH
jgi:hypothetical protein